MLIAYYRAQLAFHRKSVTIVMKIMCKSEGIRLEDPIQGEKFHAESFRFPQLVPVAHF